VLIKFNIRDIEWVCFSLNPSGRTWIKGVSEQGAEGTFRRKRVEMDDRKLKNIAW
jgi:hypothetical protein